MMKVASYKELSSYGGIFKISRLILKRII